MFDMDLTFRVGKLWNGIEEARKNGDTKKVEALEKEFGELRRKHAVEDGSRDDPFGSD